MIPEEFATRIKLSPFPEETLDDFYWKMIDFSLRRHDMHAYHYWMGFLMDYWRRLEDRGPNHDS